MTTEAPPLFIVFNARSGHEDADQTQRTIEQVLQAGGRRFEILRVEDPKRLGEIAAEAVRRAKAQQGAVVAAGGDGTINALAQASLGSGCPFGVLPQGTFNYFSRTHGIPLDTEAATRALLDAHVEPVQVGEVNGQAFLVNASVGLYPKLLEDREAYKREYGRNRLVALWAALVTLCTAHRPLRLQLQSGDATRAVRTPTLFVGNNALQLQQIGIPGTAALESGALVAITLAPMGTLALLWLMLRGAAGRLGEARGVFSFGFQHLAVQPAAPRAAARLKVATDGEVRWLKAPLQFSVAAHPLLLLRPRTPLEPA